MVADTSWPKSRSSERNRRSFMKWALLDHVGAAGVDVLGALAEDEDRVGPQVEDRPHRQDRAPCTQCLMLVTKAASLISRSFHQPKAAENWAVT